MKISFVTPVLNAFKTIEATFQSIEKSARAIEYEHILVDGGSSDGTLEVVRHKWPNTRIALEPGSSVYEAMNAGIRMANGDWIAIINADDHYEPGAVAAITKAIRANPLAEAVHGNVLKLSDSLFPEQLRTPVQGLSARLGLGIPILHPSLFVKKDVYHRLGDFRTDLRVAADQEWIYRALDSGVRLCYLDRIISRMSRGGLSEKLYEVSTMELLEIHRSRKSFWGRLGHLFFYWNRRLRSHGATPKGPVHYWIWAMYNICVPRSLRGRYGKSGE